MAIELKNIHKTFGKNHVLRGVDLVIEEGKTTTIIGGSGCGKSVCLKHMVGLFTPDEGAVAVDNVDIAACAPEELVQARNKFGFLFQGGALFDSLSVGENVVFGLRHLKKDLAEEEVQRAIREKLNLV